MILDKYIPQYISVLKGFSEREKILVALCNLQRHEVCVEKFDKIYNENLSNDFRASLDRLVNYLSGAHLDLESLKKIAMCGPDSDDYQQIEGSIAQNAFGALYFLCNYITSKNDMDLLQSIDKSFESMDVLNYDKGTPEEEEQYFNDEGRNLGLLIEKIRKSPSETHEDIKNLMVFAQAKSISIQTVLSTGLRSC
ncbi:hypothetical protein KXR87_18205 [Yokenella regensburgei]|uniref:hypothetical protein n=1 Tax=Yokenella regensburgei TaxID=158877 RepID=UPI003F181090